MSAISFLPRRTKNSWLDSWRWPSAVTLVSPSSGYKKIKSISEDTFSSRPPSLPMPSTIICWAVPDSSPIGMPCNAHWLRYKSSRCRLIANSANADMALRTSFRSPWPARSRSAMAATSVFRRRRMAAGSDGTSAKCDSSNWAKSTKASDNPAIRANSAGRAGSASSQRLTNRERFGLVKGGVMRISSLGALSGWRGQQDLQR